MGLVTVRDEWTKLVGHRFLNSQICLWIGLLQTLVCIWGVAQHCYSFIHYQKILRCDFLEGSLPLEAADAIIFDVGLFHSLWGIRGCVAEYLDGGFGRLAWCVSHIISLTVSLPFAFVSRPRPYFLWPLLIQQSAYGLGLLILLIAALPRILPQMMENTRAIPFVPISIYITGTMLNFFLLYVYWHWYWHVDSLWSSAVKIRFGQIVRNANNRSRRDKPMRPREPMEEPQELTVERLMHMSENSWCDTEEPEDFVTNDMAKSRRLQKQETNVSLIFQEAEAARANGEVSKDKSRRPSIGENKASNVLELPPTSKTVRARYPHEPPVIKALMKRGKSEIAAKHLDGAAKRAMYRRRSTREMTIDQDDQPATSSRPRVTISNLQTVSIYEEDKEIEEEPQANASSSVKTETAEQNHLKPAKRTKKNTARTSAVSPRAARILAKRQATKPKSPAKLPNGSIRNNSKARSIRRQSTESVNPIAKPTTQEPVPSPLSSPSPPPPPPIVATRLAPDAVENLVLKAQEELRTGRTRGFAAEERRSRRILPKTPDENPCGEIPRAKFYLQNSHI